MRGLRRIGLLAVSVVCVLGFSAVSAFADADDELLDKGAGALLRDLNTASINQPSAIELVNTETTKLEVPTKPTPTVSECTESEFGSFVTKNKGGAGAATGTELSVPFGVFENCTVGNGAANAPVYVDVEPGAKAASGIEVKIWDEGAAPFKVELKGLKISLYIQTPAITCKYTGTIIGVWTNGAGPFVEEASTAQSMVDFKNQKLTGSPTEPCGTATITSAKYFVETMSDSKTFGGSTDTVFFNT